MPFPAMIVSRFAPSPTGRLHLGHAFSAIRAHDLARASGGCFLLRIEDIDGTRSRPDHIAAIEADLRWLGLIWDGPVVRQSERLARYAEALARLDAMGLLYPCFCTRAEIAASVAAPHGDEGPVYPGTCRGLPRDPARLAREPHCWRLDMGRALVLKRPPPLAGEGLGRGVGPEIGAPGHRAPSPDPLSQPFPTRGEGLWWHDATTGWTPAAPLPQGDIVLARKDAPSSYHLAVTVDDAAQGITDVVRGVDLFAATHIHRLLQALLGLPTPRYHHHPLLTGPDGERLAKRRGSPSLADLRTGGADPVALAADLRAGRISWQ